MTTSIANRVRISAIVQQANAESARQDGDGNMLWQSTWSMVASINSRLASTSAPSAPDPALLDHDMHDLWHTYWHGAINTAPNSSKLDRLALGIVQAREQGVCNLKLVHATEPGSESSLDESQHELVTLPRVPATTSDGARIWTDLPFLAQDMTTHWTSDCAAMSSAQRLSGAQFLAMLAAAGAAPDDALCGIALVVLREALETPRPLAAVADQPDPGRQMRDLGVADLLPAANAWLFTAGRKLVQLSDAERGDQFPDEVGRLGELIVAVDAASSGGGGGGRGLIGAGEVPPRHGGFSLQRWMWWLRRLEQIVSVATGDDGISQGEESGLSFESLVQGMMDNMLLIAKQTSGSIAEALRRSAGRISHQPVMQLLGPDRAGVPGTVGMGSWS
ncbi:hypothetical protein N656DRAFT_764388 [Canariomyces notabilis]|uniref:Uncharacterized protein n=1 Tax=Canariomyces notabilis TaxID=2074819 RepID=A0AAN6TMC5_9PEZI|nr:hypothetical protein N656DRAFT_764388 [Canariomyces arenarius]